MHDCQLEKILAFLHGPGQKKGKTKNIYIYIGAMQMFDLYIIYIFIGAKVILVQRMQGRKTQPGES